MEKKRQYFSMLSAEMQVVITELKQGLEPTSSLSYTVHITLRSEAGE